MALSDHLDHNTRPTLQQVRRKTSLTSRQVAEMAGVPLRIEYMMEIGSHVSLEDALKVIAALSQLTGHTYTFTDLNVNLTSEITPLR